MLILNTSSGQIKAITNGKHPNIGEIIIKELEQIEVPDWCKIIEFQFLGGEPAPHMGDMKYKINLLKLESLPEFKEITTIILTNFIKFTTENSLIASTEDPPKLTWTKIYPQGYSSIIYNPVFDETKYAQVKLNPPPDVDKKKFNDKLDQMTDPNSGTTWWIILVFVFMIVMAIALVILGIVANPGDVV